MGKIRVRLLGLEEVEKRQKEEAKKRREEKKKEKEKKVRPVGGKGGERMKQIEVSEEEFKKMEEAKKLLEEKEDTKKKGETPVVRKLKKKTRGKNYQQAKKAIDKNKKYSVKEAVSLLKKIKFGKFDETVELHLNVREVGLKGEVTLPYGTGKQKRVAIVDEEILKKIEKGKIDFDVLITHPQYMPKLVKYAKILGPKGLMPNPKNGTISQNPEEVAKKFQSGLIRFKTESKFPIIHQIVGKTSFSEEALVENIKTLILAINSSEIKSAYLKSTMSPSIKLNLETQT